jgi:hypothetical protein
MSEAMKQAVTRDADNEKGFYYSALTEDEKLEYDEVVETEGLLEEIYLMRIKTKSLARREPQNLVLLMRLITCLERLVRTQFRLFKTTRSRLPEIRKLLESFKLPPDIMSKMAYKALGETPPEPAGS